MFSLSPVRACFRPGCPCLLPGDMGTQMLKGRSRPEWISASETSPRRRDTSSYRRELLRQQNLCGAALCVLVMVSINRPGRRSEERHIGGQNWFAPEHVSVWCEIPPNVLGHKCVYMHCDPPEPISRFVFKFYHTFGR